MSGNAPKLSRTAGRPGTRGLARIDAAGVAMCLALVAVWYTLSLEPLRQARAERNALDAELQPRLAKAGALKMQSQSQQNTLAAVGDQIAQGELQLRNIDQINQRLADITAAAGDFHLRLEEVRPGTPVAMQWFITMPIKLTGTGEYPDLGTFLHALPTRFPDVAVVGFEVRGEPEAHEKKPRFVLNLVWYAAPRISSSEK